MQRTIESIVDGSAGSRVAILNCFHRQTLVDHSELKGCELKEGSQTDCSDCAQLLFPVDVEPYKRTKIFTQDTVPKGFQNTHSTKDKTWGKIIIESGRLDLVVDDLDNLTFELGVGIEGIIAPQMLHHVDVVGPVAFYVEFYSK